MFVRPSRPEPSHHFPMRVTFTEEEFSKEEALHLRYMTGEANRLKEFFSWRFVNEYGDVLSDIVNNPLPALSPEDCKIIEEALFSESECKVAEGITCRLSLGRMIHDFSQRENEETHRYAFKESHLIGSFVRYLLFIRTSYARRYFEEPGLSPLYEGVGCHRYPLPSDFDLRTIVRHIFRSQVPFEKKDFEKLHILFAQYLTEICLEQHPDLKREEIFGKIHSYFSQHPPVDKGFIRFSEVSFEGSFVDWILASELPLKFLFTADDLYIPIDRFLGKTKGKEVVPLSHRGKPTESFFHALLGLIKVEDVAALDKSAFFRYAAALMQGQISANYQSESLLKDLLVQKIGSFYLVEERRAEGFKRFLDDMQFWVEKHYKQNAEARYCLMCTALALLKNELTPLEIEQAHQRLCALRLKNPYLNAIQSLTAKVPFDVVVACLELFSLLAFPFTEIGTWDFKEPSARCRFDRSWIQFSLKPDQALDTLLKYKHENEKRWKGVEKNLLEFFELFHPLATLQEIPQALLEGLKDECCERLKQLSLDLLDENSPLLKQIALALVGALPFAATKKTKLAEEYFLSALEHTDQPERVVAYCQPLLGEGVIPPLDSENFSECYIANLFAFGRGSEERASKLWFQALEAKKITPFSISLIATLASRQPEYALRLFHALNKGRFFDRHPEETAAMLTRCFHLLRVQTYHDHRREALTQELGVTLWQLLNNKKYAAKNRPSGLSPALLWYSKKLKETHPAKAEEIKNLASRKKLLGDFEQHKVRHEKFEACWSAAIAKKEYPKALELLKAGKSDGILSVKEEVLSLRTLLFESEDRFVTNRLLELLTSHCGTPFLDVHLYEELVDSLIKKFVNKTLSRKEKNLFGSFVTAAYFSCSVLDKLRMVALCYQKQIPLQWSTFDKQRWVEDLKRASRESSGEEIIIVERLYSYGVSLELFDPESYLGLLLTLSEKTTSASFLSGIFDFCLSNYPAVNGETLIRLFSTPCQLHDLEYRAQKLHAFFATNTCPDKVLLKKFQQIFLKMCLKAYENQHLDLIDIVLSPFFRECPNSDNKELLIEKAQEAFEVMSASDIGENDLDLIIEFLQVYGDSIDVTNTHWAPLFESLVHYQPQALFALYKRFIIPESNEIEDFVKLTSLCLLALERTQTQEVLEFLRFYPHHLQHRLDRQDDPVAISILVGLISTIDRYLSHWVKNGMIEREIYRKDLLVLQAMAENLKKITGDPEIILATSFKIAKLALLAHNEQENVRTLASLPSRVEAFCNRGKIEDDTNIWVQLINLIQELKDSGKSEEVVQIVQRLEKGGEANIPPALICYQLYLLLTQLDHYAPCERYLKLCRPNFSVPIAGKEIPLAIFANLIHLARHDTEEFLSLGREVFNNFLHLVEQPMLEQIVSRPDQILILKTFVESIFQGVNSSFPNRSLLIEFAKECILNMSKKFKGAPEILALLKQLPRS